MAWKTVFPRGKPNVPLQKALLSPQLSAGNAILAEGIAELLEQYAESTAARVAELVNGHRPANDEQRYFTSEEAAKYLRCSKGRLYNLTSQGRLKGRKEGGRLLFTRADLDALVEQAS